MGLEEYHRDLTSSMPLTIMRESWQATVDLVEEYSKVFACLGKLGVNMKIHIDLEATGTIQKQRRKSLLFKHQFDQILNICEEMDIIEDLGSEPMDRCSNGVLTPKKDKKKT